MSGSRRATAALAAAVAVAAPPPLATASDGIDLFARVPAPGSPEGLVVSPDGDTVYTSTYQSIQGGASGPSKIFAFASNGRVIRTYTIAGQTLDGTQGAGGLAFDAAGRLYAIIGNPDRVATIDTASGTQRDYATFTAEPQCSTPTQRPSYPCSASLLTSAPLTPAIAFGADGTLYASDTTQALIWKIPPGGGPAQVWFTDQRFTSPFGINKLLVTPDARHIIFSETSHIDPTTGIPASGAIWEIPIEPDGQPGPLTQLWQTPPGVFPDGIALTRSGDLWIATLGTRNSIIELSPTGAEIAQLPGSELENEQQPIPLDSPSSVTFLGSQLLIANSSFLANDPDHWALLQLPTHETPVEPFRPAIPLAPPKAPPSAATPARRSHRHRHTPRWWPKAHARHWPKWRGGRRR